MFEITEVQSFISCRTFLTLLTVKPMQEFTHTDTVNIKQYLLDSIKEYRAFHGAIETTKYLKSLEAVFKVVQDSILGFDLEEAILKTCYLFHTYNDVCNQYGYTHFKLESIKGYDIFKAILYSPLNEEEQMLYYASVISDDMIFTDKKTMDYIKSKYPVMQELEFYDVNTIPTMQSILAYIGQELGIPLDSHYRKYFEKLAQNPTIENKTKAMILRNSLERIYSVSMENFSASLTQLSDATLSELLEEIKPEQRVGLFTSLMGDIKKLLSKNYLHIEENLTAEFNYVAEQLKIKQELMQEVGLPEEEGETSFVVSNKEIRMFSMLIHESIIEKIFS